MAFEFLRGAAAREALQNAAFQEQWRRLYQQCAWATAYQREDFARIWYQVYDRRYEPVLLCWREGETLEALWAMALGTGGLITAGGHQCEYQSWLCLPGRQSAFLAQALAQIRPLCRHQPLELRYLPPRHPLAGQDLRLLSRRLGVQLRALPFPRPLVDLAADSVGQRSLNKKKNRRRLRLLGELGELRFERVRDAAQLAILMPAIAQCYDERQQGLSGQRPFADDPDKAEFHLRLLAETGLLHVTTFRAGEELLGAQMGPSDRGEMHMGVYGYATAHAEHSPGRMTLHQLAALLEAEGLQTLDLTPGGQWKETYATHHDEVLVLLVFYSRLAAWRFDLLRAVRRRLRPLRQHWQKMRGRR